MPGFHIEHVMMKYLINHKRGGGPLGLPLNPPLHLMKHCNAKSLACIAPVVQQLSQTPLVVLIDIYFEVMSR